MDDLVTESARQQLLLEQYKLYVELADRVSARRVDASKFYISVLSAMLVVIPFAVDDNTPTDVRRIVFVGIGLLGSLLCLVWILNVRSYKQLNALKFKVIHEMESQLPFAAFDREWEILDLDAERFSYRRLSAVEQYVPLLLLLPYVSLIALALLL